MMLEQETKILLVAIQQAGVEIARLQQHGFTSSYKSNHSLLTSADLLANQILQDQLLSRFPQYGWLSEETVDDYSRLTAHRVWIVDPIDGTKEFAAGIPEYALSVALVEEGFPILAAVFNPVRQELFYAIRRQGAWLNHTPLYCDCNDRSKLIILASRTEIDNGLWDDFMELNDVQAVGSIAYKLGLVAAGRAHAVFSLGPKSEWDIAAGVLLIEEAGGVVSDKHKQHFIFNQRYTRVNSIIASSRNTYDLIHEQINRVEKQHV